MTAQFYDMKLPHSHGLTLYDKANKCIPNSPVLPPVTMTTLFLSNGSLGNEVPPPIL